MKRFILKKCVKLAYKLSGMANKFAEKMDDYAFKTEYIYLRKEKQAANNRTIISIAACDKAIKESYSEPVREQLNKPPIFIQMLKQEGLI